MAVTKVQKRNGEIVDFDASKIKAAIFAAAKAVAEVMKCWLKG